MRGIILTQILATGSSPLCPQVERLVRVEHISGREREVLALLAVGADDKTIAGELHVSHRTVRSHITALFMKLRVRNRTEVALLGLFSHLYTCEACRKRISAEPPAQANGLP
jgi:DNA-binding NarL/FixJ family response regulator